MLAQLLLEVLIGLVQGAKQCVIFATALLLLGAAALLARNRHAAVGRERFHSLGEFLVIEVHHKAQGIAARATAKAVVELLLWFYAERGGFFLMKRAAGGVVLACLAQFDALVDDIDDIDPAEQVINKILGNQTGHVGPRPE